MYVDKMKCSLTISTASLSVTNTASSIGAPCKLLVTRP